MDKIVKLKAEAEKLEARVSRRALSARLAGRTVTGAADRRDQERLQAVYDELVAAYAARR